MKIVQDLTVLYKKSPIKFIVVSVIVFMGLIFAWYITIPLVIVIFLGKKFKKDEEDKKDTKKKCPHCKTEIDWEASRCPNCHGKIYVWTSSKKILVTILATLFFIGIFNMNSSTPSSSSNNTSVNTLSPEQTTSNRKVMSIVFAEDVIKKNLKAPSTTKFVDVQAYELSNLKDVWAVNGYLDSQNSFGAMIRNQWEVQLDYRDGKGGTVKSILLDGEKIL